MTFVENNTAVSRGDFRWDDIAINADAKLSLGAEVRFLNGDRGSNRGSFGFALSAVHTQQVWGGFNQVIRQYGQGPASTLSVTSDYNATDKAKTYRQAKLFLPGQRDRFWRFRT